MKIIQSLIIYKKDNVKKFDLFLAKCKQISINVEKFNKGKL